MFTNTTVDKLIELNLPPATVATLTYSDGVDCFVHNETEVDTALEQTDVVSEFAELVSNLSCEFTDQWGSNILASLMDNDVFDEDFVASCRDEFNEEYDSFELQELVSEFINDNFYDQEFVEKEVERYDHKRGFITLSATVKTTVGELIENNVFCSQWNVEVPLHGGTFTIEN